MLGALSGASAEWEAAGEGGGAGDKALLTRTPTHSTSFLDKHAAAVPVTCSDHNGSAGPHKKGTREGRKTFAFWTLVTLLFVLAVGNLLLTFTILGVLRLGHGMESMEFVPEQGAVKLAGRVDLDHLYKRDGLLESFRDAPLSIESDGGSVMINLQTRQSQPETKLEVNSSGVFIRGVSGLEVREPNTGKLVFSSGARSLHIPGGARQLSAQLVSTKRVAAPAEEPLLVRSEGAVRLRGAEGAHMEGKELLWSADQDVYLRSINGSVVLSGKEGVFIDVKNIPIALPPGKEPKQAPPTGQFKVCVCMPQGKLFRLAVPTGQRASCSHVNMTAQHNPCL